MSTKAIALDPLREVGLNQLTIQATLAGGLDAQALGNTEAVYVNS